ncbi:MAG: hypothetical protein ACRDOO_29200 [Actinomadura sp.]
MADVGGLTDRVAQMLGGPLVERERAFAFGPHLSGGFGQHLRAYPLDIRDVPAHDRPDRLDLAA